MAFDAMVEISDLTLLLREVHSRGLPRFPVLIIFFTGSSEPPDCLPMKRCPMPSLGFPFDADFPEHLQSALAINEAVHDGAVAFGRLTNAESYKCVGWSYLIGCTRSVENADSNRGAAYNSAISLSSSAGIDCVSLFSKSDLEIFGQGRLIFNLKTS
jgi:hypothetical protein